MAAKRKRKDPRGDATRIALIEAAAQPFAARDICSVSLKEISAAAGSGNNGIVAYYFRTKLKLLESIFSYSLPQLEVRRQGLLRRADDAGLGHDMFTLYYIAWLPLLEQRDTAGKPSCAGFLSSLSRFDPSGKRWTGGKGYLARREIEARSRKLKHALSDRNFFDPQRLTTVLMLEAIKRIAASAAALAPPGDAQTLKQLHDKLKLERV